HPEDAYERGILDQDPVEIRNSRGAVRVNARVTDRIKRGVVFLPMHWGKLLGKDHGRANNVTHEAIDPQSKQPGFKYAAVTVERYQKDKQKIVIVGAGAAAFRFINTYRSLNQDDELHVFSREEWPFYDRVLLPDYAIAHKTWEDLLKFKKGEFERLNTQLYVSNEVTAIDRDNKQVTDSKGVQHDYDLLVMATGSRAFVPPGVPLYLPGVFTMRDRRNADDLKDHLLKDHHPGDPDKHLIIVGGGLLGLELAAAMSEVAVKVSIVQLGSRLMERQLDPIASSLLREYIENDLDIRVITNDEVRQIDLLVNKNGLQASLKSGLHLHCDALVYAIGTRPNTELGKDCGLEAARGIKVNDHLQTSDPEIFALGEIAEHQQKLNGITAAAEQQADVCARFIAGDVTGRYNGSTPMNILKFPNLDLCSIGMTEIPVDGKGYDEILFLDRSELYYKKCIIHHDRLVGAILLGDKAEFAEFKELIDHQTELSEKRVQLLRSGKVSEPVIGELVCSCNNQGVGNIEKAIAEGCSSLNEICSRTGAGLGCGSCKPEVHRILESVKEKIN
ncbi:MAG: FAD-dependent oxidoreductase, partial [Bacteroidota bacterium]